MPAQQRLSKKNYYVLINLIDVPLSQFLNQMESHLSSEIYDRQSYVFNKLTASIIGICLDVGIFMILFNTIKSIIHNID